MAQITKIEEQKNKKRVNIFVDGDFFCGIGKETAVSFRLKTGMEINEKILNEMVFESETKSAFEKGIDYLASRMHSKSELAQKLLKKGYTSEVIDAAIKKLESYSYVNDEIFSKWFFETNSKYSVRVIEGKLRQKGVDNKIIEKVSKNSNPNKDYELCVKFSQKYLKTKSVETREEIQKMYAFLARKGFDFELIKKVCRAQLNKDLED
ncbi:MAG: RecX family transcriptional regulator [Clostridia bacterium]|nr:RecX family transcriptional regulator [Clostridia bacterium]